MTQLRYEELAWVCPTCHVPIVLPEAGQSRCQGCGRTSGWVEGIPSFVPSETEDLLRRRYEDIAEQGQETAAAVGYRSERLHTLMARAIQSEIRPLPIGFRVLDVGCGHGRFSANWARSNPVVGLDFSLNMLRMAARNGLLPIHADGLAIPLADAQFDVVICAEVIQHFRDLEPFFNELVRLVRPGGHLLVSTLNAESLVRRSFRLMRAGLGVHPDFDVILRRHEDVAQSLRAFNGSILETAWVHFPAQSISHAPSAGMLRRCLSTNFVVHFRKGG